MDTWTKIAGYPYITVTRGNNKATITQKRLFKDTTISASNDDCWFIPITYTTEIAPNFTNTHPDHWLTCDHVPNGMEITDLPDNGAWILFNIQMTGVYRVNYDLENWQRLIAVLNSDDFKTIHTMNRAQLITDIMSFAWTKIQPYEIAISLLRYLEREDEYVPWKAALDSINKIEILLHGKSLLSDFHIFMMKLLQTVYQTIDGLNAVIDADDRISLTRHKLISEAACTYGVPACISEATDYFTNWMNQPDSYNIPSDIRSVVYCMGIKHGNGTHWQFLWEKYLASTDESKQLQMIAALACTLDQNLLNNYLELTPDEPVGRERIPHNRVAFEAIVNNKIGFSLALDKYTANCTRFGATRFVKPLMDRATTECIQDSLVNVVKSYPEHFKYFFNMDECKETMKLNIQFVNNNCGNLARALGVTGHNC